MQKNCKQNNSCKHICRHTSNFLFANCLFCTNKNFMFECVICFEETHVDDCLASECGHLYHPGCWLAAEPSSKDKCAQCRVNWKQLFYKGNRLRVISFCSASIFLLVCKNIQKAFKLGRADREEIQNILLPQVSTFDCIRL